MNSWKPGENNKVEKPGTVDKPTGNQKIKPEDSKPSNEAVDSLPADKGDGKLSADDFDKLKGRTDQRVNIQREGAAEFRKSGNGDAFYSRTDFDVCTDGSGASHGDKTHLNGTAMSYKGGKALNADTTPYVVLSSDIAKKNGLQLGDLAAVRYKDKILPAVYGETNPNKVGEGSRSLAQGLGINPNPNSGGLKSKDVEMIFFPGSAKKGGWTQSELTSENLAPIVQKLMSERAGQ
jgi:hypothetical protein